MPRNLYVIEYDFTILTVQLNERPAENHRFVSDKFEEALAEYRRIKEIPDNLLGNSPVSNLKVYKAPLVEEVDMDPFL